MCGTWSLRHPPHMYGVSAKLTICRLEGQAPTGHAKVALPSLDCGQYKNTRSQCKRRFPLPRPVLQL